MIAQAGFELRLLLRNGEQLLLTLVIPVALLIGVTLVPAVPLDAPAGAARVPFGLFLLVSALATLPKVGALVLAGWAMGRTFDMPWLAGLAAALLFAAGLWALGIRRVP